MGRAGLARELRDPDLGRDRHTDRGADCDGHEVEEERGDAVGVRHGLGMRSRWIASVLASIAVRIKCSSPVTTMPIHTAPEITARGTMKERTGSGSELVMGWFGAGGGRRSSPEQEFTLESAFLFPFREGLGQGLISPRLEHRRQ